MAADFVRLKDVEKFARAGPQQLRLGPRSQDFFAFAHERYRIDSSVSNSAGKDRDNCRNGWIEHLGNRVYLIRVHDRGHIKLDALHYECAEDRATEFPFGVHHRDLNIDVLSP